MSDVTEVRIHTVTLGDVVSINGSWVNAADHEELAAVGRRITDLAVKLRAIHEDEAG
ncbi:hypothetical protein [Nocardiopsis sp. CA-288880]|uniref:hypothetical protein n=1 Tax=Nocardiopsis sp. CA-288880 TaxID=3239995 RepID=UPI003D97D758